MMMPPPPPTPCASDECGTTLPTATAAATGSSPSPAMALRALYARCSDMGFALPASAAVEDAAKSSALAAVPPPQSKRFQSGGGPHLIYHPIPNRPSSAKAAAGGGGARRPLLAASVSPTRTTGAGGSVEESNQRLGYAGIGSWSRDRDNSSLSSGSNEPKEKVAFVPLIGVHSSSSNPTYQTNTINCSSHSSRSSATRDSFPYVARPVARRPVSARAAPSTSLPYAPPPLAPATTGAEESNTCSSKVTQRLSTSTNSDTKEGAAALSISQRVSTQAGAEELARLDGSETTAAPAIHTVFSMSVESNQSSATVGALYNSPVDVHDHGGGPLDAKGPIGVTMLEQPQQLRKTNPMDAGSVNSTTSSNRSGRPPRNVSLPATAVTTTWIPMSPESSEESGRVGHTEIHVGTVYDGDATSTTTSSQYDPLVTSLEIHAFSDSNRSQGPSGAKVVDRSPPVAHTPVVSAAPSVEVDMDGGYDESLRQESARLGFAVPIPTLTFTESGMLAASIIVPLSREQLWRLLGAYIRVKLFVRRWRTTHDTIAKQQSRQVGSLDIVGDLLEANDSTNWIHSYKVEWRERNHVKRGRSGTIAGTSDYKVPSENASVSAEPPDGFANIGRMGSGSQNFSQNSNGPNSSSPTHSEPLPINVRRTTIDSFMNSVNRQPMAVRGSNLAATTRRGGDYEPAFLYLSVSHVYISSQFLTHSLTLRYTDILHMAPRRSGLEICYRPPNTVEVPDEDPSTMSCEFSDGDSSWTTEATTMRHASIASLSRLGASSPAVPAGSTSRSVSPSLAAQHIPTVQPGGRVGLRLIIRCKDPTSILLTALDLQAKFLRVFSLSLADRLLLKSQTKTLHIVHFNDVYHLPPFKPAGARGIVGGAGRFHTVLSKIRESVNPLVLFSGDFMGPSLMSVITKGKQMIDAFNFLGVNYGCFGNHEFDYTLRTLKEVVHGYTQGKHIYTGSQTTWVMSNMVEGDGTPLGGAKPYAVAVRGNIRIGILGLCENWLPQCANLHPSEARYLDMFECGERLAQHLKDVEKCELVFALSHNRNNMDRELGIRCPSIDYIFGGHDHKFKSDPKHRFIKSGQEFEYLTKIEVTLTPGQKPRYNIDCVPITYDIEESNYLKGLITRYDAKMAEKLGRTIGKCEAPLDSTEETVRFKEGHLTNFIVDVIQVSMETELAFLGAAAISGKEVKPPGNVTLGDIFGWFPNETKVMTMRLKGSTIKKTLDVMVRELPAEAPSFPHPSQQLRFTINMLQKPPTCENIFIDRDPLDMDRWYLCAVEDFVGVGKAKYKHVAAEGEVVLGEDDAIQVVTLVRDFFLKKRVNTTDANEAAALKNVTKIVSSATHIGVDMDMAKSQRFIRSLICELIHCNRSAIFLVDDEHNEIHFVPDGSDKEIRMPKDKGLAGHSATSCKLLNIDDAYEDPRFNRAVDVATGYRTKTVLCCPVLLDGKNCSAVVQAINKDSGTPFDDIDEITLRVLGEQVSFQLQYQVVFQRARSELEFTMSWVLDIFRSFTSDVALDLVSGLRTITTHAASLFRCDTVRVYRFDAQNNQICYLEEGLDDESIVVSTELNPASFVGEVMDKLELRTLRDASRTVMVKPSDGYCLRNALGVPLMNFTDHCIGVLLLGDKPRGFTHDDETVAHHFSRLAAISIENSVRLSKIMTASSETILPTIPHVPLGRITIKGGWATVRKAFREAKNQRREAREAGASPPSFKAIFCGRTLEESLPHEWMDGDHSLRSSHSDSIARELTGSIKNDGSDPPRRSRLGNLFRRASVRLSRSAATTQASTTSKSPMPLLSVDNQRPRGSISKSRGDSEGGIRLVIPNIDVSRGNHLAATADETGLIDHVKTPMLMSFGAFD